MTDAAPTSAPASPRRKVSVAAWSVVVIIFIFLLLGAIATPKFVAFPCRSKQSEAKGNLKSLQFREREMHGRVGRYSTDLEKLGFAAQGSKVRYLYGFLYPAAEDQLNPPRPVNLSDPSSVVAKRVLTGEFNSILGDTTASAATFKAFAIGDIDSDETLDVWTISHVGELTNVLSDCEK